MWEDVGATRQKGLGSPIFTLKPQFERDIKFYLVSATILDSLIVATWIEERRKGKKHLSFEDHELEAGHHLFCSNFLCQNLVN